MRQGVRPREELGRFRFVPRIQKIAGAVEHVDVDDTRQGQGCANSLCQSGNVFEMDILDQRVRQDLRHATTLLGERGHDLLATFINREERAGDTGEED